MDRNRLEGRWKRMKGRAQPRWAKLTDDDLERTDGKRDELVGRVQQLYGRGRDEVEREGNDWCRELN